VRTTLHLPKIYLLNLQTSCYKCDIIDYVNLNNDQNLVLQFLGNRQEMRFNFFTERLYFKNENYVQLKFYEHVIVIYLFI